MGTIGEMMRAKKMAGEVWKAQRLAVEVQKELAWKQEQERLQKMLGTRKDGKQIRPIKDGR